MIITNEKWNGLLETRATNPDAISAALASRTTRSLLADDGSGVRWSAAIRTVSGSTCHRGAQPGAGAGGGGIGGGGGGGSGHGSLAQLLVFGPPNLGCGAHLLAAPAALPPMAS